MKKEEKSISCPRQRIHVANSPFGTARDKHRNKTAWRRKFILITGGADAGIKGNGAAGPVRTVSKEPAATKLTRLGWRWTRSGVSKKNGIERVD